MDRRILTLGMGMPVSSVRNDHYNWPLPDSIPNRHRRGRPGPFRVASYFRAEMALHCGVPWT